MSDWLAVKDCTIYGFPNKSKPSGHKKAKMKRMTRVKNDVAQPQGKQTCHEGGTLLHVQAERPAPFLRSGCRRQISAP